MDRPVRDFMTRDVSVISRDAEVHELIKLFLEKHIHGVPVTDTTGRLVGVVSQTDVIAWHFEVGLDGSGFYDVAQLQPGFGLHTEQALLEDEENENLADEGANEEGALPLSEDMRSATVGEVMTPLVHAIRPESSASDAAVRMLRHQIHRLIVVDSDLKVLGIVCAMDLLALIPGVGATLRG